MQHQIRVTTWSMCCSTVIRPAYRASNSTPASAGSSSTAATSARAATIRGQRILVHGRRRAQPAVERAEHPPSIITMCRMMSRRSCLSHGDRFAHWSGFTAATLASKASALVRNRPRPRLCAHLASFDQQFGEPVVTLSHPMLHARPDHGIADLLRRIPDRAGHRGAPLVLVLDEGRGDQRFGTVLGIAVVLRLGAPAARARRSRGTRRAAPSRCRPARAPRTARRRRPAGPPRTHELVPARPGPTPEHVRGGSAAKTRCRGASKTRVCTISPSVGVVIVTRRRSSRSVLLAAVQFDEQVVEALVALGPELAVAVEPVGGLLERPGNHRQGRRWASRRREAGRRVHTFRCLMIAGWVIANGSANSATVASPPASRARIARRAGWARAANVASRRSAVPRLTLGYLPVT